MSGLDGGINVTMTIKRTAESERVMNFGKVEPVKPVAEEVRKPKKAAKKQK
jgi:hypothetical protein